jgi:hypothetical protein
MDTVQRFVKSVAGLNTIRRIENPPQVARPTIVWEAPWRGQSKLLTRYKYIIPVKLYGQLQASSVDELQAIQEALILGLEDRDGRLDILDPNKVKVGQIKEAYWSFDTAETLEQQVYLYYEVTYSRPVPVDPGPPRKVGTDEHLRTYYVHVGDVYEGG